MCGAKLPAMRLLFVLTLGSLLGCSADLVLPDRAPDGGTRGTQPSADLAGLSDPNAPTGDMTLPCPNGQHLEAMICVADEVTCASEFPCPMGQQCIGGRCAIIPGPCATNDDCPTGDSCVMGTCAPVCPNNGQPQCKADADCGGSNVCIACMCVSINNCVKPTADISTPQNWKAHQDLHLDEALGAFGGAIASILKQLRDGILGCPPGSGGTCFLFQIVAGFLPDWAKTLIVAVGNFADILDNHDFFVDSEMTFTKNGKPSGYDGTDHWEMLTFSYQNMTIMKKPEDVMQIGQPVIIPFSASAVCGVLYVDKHKVEGVLSGILKWIVDTVVQISTCQNGGPCYMSLSDAIVGAIDCGQIQDFAAKAACIGFTSGLGKKIDDALNQWLLNYSLMTLKGTAIVNPNGHALEMGHWDGTLGDGIGIFKNFNGEWTATR